MAHSSIHFAIGMWMGTILMAPSVWRSLKKDEKTSFSIGKLLVISYSLAIFAIIPNLLRRGGLPETICSNPLTNIFLLHQILDRMTCDGMLKGEMAVISCFSIQYAFIIFCIKKRLHQTP